MKKILLLAAASLGFTMAVNAQDSIAFQATIKSPAQNSALSCSDSISFEVQVINLGPTNIVTGDTLLLVAPNNKKGQGWRIPFTGNFNVNDTTVIPMKIHNKEFNAWIAINPNDTTTGSAKYVEDGDIIPNGKIGLSFRMGNSTSNTKYAMSSKNVGYFSTFDYQCNLSANDIKVSQSLNVYPNPTASTISFSYDFTVANNATVRIMDLMGRTLVTKDFNKQAVGTNTFTLDVASLSNGIYYVEMVSGDVRGVSKFTVSK